MRPGLLFERPLRGVERERKRRIVRAVREGRAVTDPADAQLAVELAQHVQRLRGAGWSRWELVLVALATVPAIAGIATGRWLSFETLVPLLALALPLYARLVFWPLARKAGEAEKLNRQLVEAQREGGR